ncbi:MAG: hypothetical protein J6386_20365 [Candidatus Synoicihabitans palmerolidicus]|nr:hypothetical protein [Candidatus Synoicihabitans palmerolidicus]
MASWFGENSAWVQEDVAGEAALVNRGAVGAPQLRTWLEISDNLVRLSYRLPEDAPEGGRAVLMMQARYPVVLIGVPGQWHTVLARVRSSRYDEANIKTANAVIIDVVRDGEIVAQNEVFEKGGRGLGI